MKWIKIVLFLSLLLFAFGFNTFDWFLNTGKKAWEQTELMPRVFVVSWYLYILAFFSTFSAGLLFGYSAMSIRQMQERKCC